jgi:DNA gyrase subunit B
MSNETPRYWMRHRPEMYIGSIGPRGLQALFSEAVDNSVEEAVAGHARHIDVVLHADGSVSVTDDGRGIPVGNILPQDVPGVTLALTDYHIGPKIRQGEIRLARYGKSIGVVCLNALSEWLEVTVRQGGSAYFQRFQQGIPVAPLLRIGEAPLNEAGTYLRWQPDPEIFGNCQLLRSTIRNRLRTLAFLCPGTRVSLLDEVINRREMFVSDTGVEEYVEVLNTGYPTLHDPILFRHRQDDLHIDAALQYRDGCPPVTLLSFANHYPTPEGGSHERGFWKAMTETVSNYARSRGYLAEGKRNLSIRQVSSGLTVVLSVRIADLKLAGPTAGILGNEEVEPRITTLVREGLRSFLERKPDAWEGLLWQWKFHSSKWYVADKNIRWGP